MLFIFLFFHSSVILFFSAKKSVALLKCFFNKVFFLQTLFNKKEFFCSFLQFYFSVPKDFAIFLFYKFFLKKNVALIIFFFQIP